MRIVYTVVDHDVLSYNPWGGDDSDYRVLDNRMVNTRVSHECAICFERTVPHTRLRAQREVYDGQAKTFYFCNKCCEAMARQQGGADPDGELIEYRTQLGMQRR